MGLRLGEVLKSSESKAPLDGVVVLDLGQIYQGPYATFLMARAGADVVKIEPPHGEPLRRREVEGIEPSFPMGFLNSNKRGITLNLKTSRGRDLLQALVEKADVLLENFAPGAMERLGVGCEVLRSLNPRLIYASGTGYGLSGRDRDRLALDVTIQASAGIMSITGPADGPPMRAGPAMSDFIGGSHLYGAVMMALYERTRTGVGRLVEVAMQDAVYPTLLSDLGLQYRAGGEIPERRGNLHSGVAPYNVYSTSDGYIALLCVTDNQWLHLLEAMGRQDLRDDPRFESPMSRCDHAEETDAIVAEWAAELTREEAYNKAREHRVPCAPVRDLDEVTNDPHLHERGMLQRMQHPQLGDVVLPNTPIRLHGAVEPPLEPSPALGQHNEEIYSGWLGLSTEEIERLRQEGVL